MDQVAGYLDLIRERQIDRGDHSTINAIEGVYKMIAEHVNAPDANRNEYPVWKHYSRTFSHGSRPEDRWNRDATIASDQARINLRRLTQSAEHIRNERTQESADGAEAGYRSVGKSLLRVAGLRWNPDGKTKSPYRSQRNP